MAAEGEDSNRGFSLQTTRHRERDPEIYGTIARGHRGQLVHVFIRDVSPQDEQRERFAAAFHGIPERKWTVFRAADELTRVDLNVEE